MNKIKVWFSDTVANDGVNICKALTYKGNKLSLSWLLDSACAVKYQEFVMSGPIQVNTAPTSPYGTKMKPLFMCNFFMPELSIKRLFSNTIFYRNNFQGFDTNGVIPFLR